jgi:hypothetical protein
MSDPRNSDDLVKTRMTLHAVAETLLAGPQSKESATIRLNITSSGFRTIREPLVEYSNGRVSHQGSSALVGGNSLSALGTALGITPQFPADAYTPTTALAWDEPLHWDEESAARIVAWFSQGVEALNSLTDEVTHVLWPEHFDAAIAWDEVNYGVSPGDEHHAEPYAYVGPWTPREGDFWNAPFGAILPCSQVQTSADLLAFFVEGRRLARR